MSSYTDQCGRSITVSKPPRRIISLVPSQTELLAHLELDHEVVGITKFCIRPKSWFENKTRIGGTKSVKLDRIRALKPDLIIANKEENEKEQIEALAKEFPLWISDIHDLPEAYQMMAALGKILDRETAVTSLIERTKAGFQALKKCPKRLKVAYFIWQQPMMLAGRDTFIDHLLEVCGFENVARHLEGRYPEVDQKTLHALSPDLIFLSSEPFPFQEKHREAFANYLPIDQVYLVDGEYFSWYGSRLLQAPPYFQSLIDRLTSTTAVHQ